ncbi:MAG: hypothetical protein A3H96_19545 [Acidobacteria bacterium RIFCSPLOWO2_02_FULL_67_36]|nr:MAG: hypothetical protein A3H96_19545 [Acidobacteria bacterium RIFCSPLOWO2_02_FULL_67_36]OFW25313.1 MAG: hypothetical protein A3G21_20070 [Acidobacteria bacterium RIFCSPLOWO2_12_FULL_66_21]
MRRIPAVLTVLAFSAPFSPEGQAIPIARAPAAVRPFIQRADAAFTRIRSAHLTELAGTMRANGAAGAIGVCHLSSAAVMDRIRREEQIAVGWTSDRLRNPTSTPPAWAAPIVRQKAGARAASVSGFYVDLGDRVGVLRPMPEVALCAGCHGPADKLSPGVRAVLKDRYPADRAINFKDGEIRGWLWAEIWKVERRRQVYLLPCELDRARNPPEDRLVLPELLVW